mgnify:CR=1 FL=1
MPDHRIQGGGIFFEREIFRSRAFLSLSKNGIKLLLAVLDARIQNPNYKKHKAKGHRADRFINTRELKASYDHLKKHFGMNVSAVARGKDELLAKGFISIVHPGGSGKHDPAIFALEDDFKTWKPGMIIRERPHDVHRGFQGRLLGATAEPHELKQMAG